MSYCEKIRELTKEVPITLVDFTLPRKKASMPRPATTNFITNKEQGDWAESILLRAINEISKNFVAVKYGKSDDLMAGEEGFPELWQEFQTELDTIGKRPDILIFNRNEFDEKIGLDISQIPHQEVTDYVKKAIAGIEVRSSAFLINRYELVMRKKTEYFTQIALETKDKILNEYIDILEHPKRQKYIPILQGITPETLSAISFRVPGWYSNERLVEVNNLFGIIKNSLDEIQKRNELSITVKNEDLQVVYKWIETFGVPHYYFQVFFDKVIGISFEEILSIISVSDNEEVLFKSEKNKKNQDKPTVHIYSSTSKIIAGKVKEPEHKSKRKESYKGRLLFYVTFEGGTAFLDIDNLRNILGIGETEF
jgi:AccI restriction endonuclease